MKLLTPEAVERDQGIFSFQIFHSIIAVTQLFLDGFSKSADSLGCFLTYSEKMKLHYDVIEILIFSNTLFLKIHQEIAELQRICCEKSEN